MPGIVTHSRILDESIEFLSKKEKKTYLLRSIEALFHTPEHRTAGLFGAIGPNLFDYLPLFRKKSIYGSELSFFLHNGGSSRFLEAMTSKLYTYPDKNTEWAALQRAYLYGFISHIIADAVFHPFVFYYSGFPTSYTKKELHYFREQNLLFQYHLDNYLQFYDEKSSRYNFSFSDMFPINTKNIFHTIDEPVKSLLLHALGNTCGDLSRHLMPIRKKANSEMPPSAGFSLLDAIPHLIRMTYSLKRSENRRLADFLARIRRTKLFYSDFLVRYPMNRRFNKNILNLHRERWEHPAGKPGLHYESVQNLMLASCARIVELWEEIESSLYGTTRGETSREFVLNAYTGDRKLTYHDMKIKRPIRLPI